MASSFALKRLVSSRLVPTALRGGSLLRPAAAASYTTLSRLFNTNAVREFDDEEERRLDESGRRSVPTLSRRREEFLSDVFDPFSPSRSLSQVLNMMDQFMENPILSSPRGSGAVRRGWDARETEDALNLKIDMPGLGREDVNVSVEQNTLIIKGEGGKETEEDSEDGARRYTSRIDLPEKIYKTDQIKAEMKNGVLKVVVPKVKEEERKDVFHVTIE